MKNAFKLSMLGGCLSLLFGLMGVFAVFQLPEHDSSEPDNYAVEVLVREALGRSDPLADSSTEQLVINAAALADGYAQAITHLLDLVLYGAVAFLLVSFLCFAAAVHSRRSQTQ